MLNVKYFPNKLPLGEGGVFIGEVRSLGQMTFVTFHRKRSTFQNI